MSTNTTRPTHTGRDTGRDSDQAPAANLDAPTQVPDIAASRGDGIDHLDRTRAALGSVQRNIPVLRGWADLLARSLTSGGRLLVAGNGGSAAEAQHLTAELVGRYENERRPLGAIALHAETSTLTALVNDYGGDALFARQVRAHGRPGDVLLCLSTSGRSPNLLGAVRSADAIGIRSWAMTGPGPNPLADHADDAVLIDAPTTASIQEAHLVAIHILCGFIDSHEAVKT